MSIFASRCRLDCSAVELVQMRCSGEDFLLLDVRTHNEYMEARLEPSLHMPLRELNNRLPELDAWSERAIVVICHSGARSYSACLMLEKAGFSGVRNLSGGICAYAKVDPEGIVRA